MLLYIIMDNKLNDKLSKRFLTGLKKYNLDYEEVKKNWYYMGGENGIHKKYLNKYFNDDIIPEHNNFCICGHKIKNNCYITDGEFVLSIGESCVNKFVRKLNKIWRTNYPELDVPIFNGRQFYILSDLAKELSDYYRKIAREQRGEDLEVSYEEYAENWVQSLKDKIEQLENSDDKEQREFALKLK